MRSISQGPIPLDAALAIARQIADALEYAHDRAVIHRDLKPANVKVTPDGVVKVLDFGLAKIAESPSAQANPASSPTLTVRAATQAGLILGTAAYMAPEQARAQAVDRRADIWAFGAVLFEMLSGKMAFQGDNITDILASVVKLEPDWSSIPLSTPPVIRRLITRCLTKDRKRRLQAIGEARLVLEEGLDEAPTIVSPKAPSRRHWLWLALAASLFALATLSFIHFRETQPPGRVLRYSILPPEKSQINTFAISPDGRYLVVAAGVEGRRHLYLRPLDVLSYQELRGTDDASYPFWSPDSRHIGFFAQGKLKRTGIEGTPPQILCDARDGRGGTWNREGMILFAPTNAGGIMKVAAVGGVAVAATKVSSREIHRFPLFLPDGRRFFYLVSLGGKDANGVMVSSLDEQSPRKVLTADSSVSWLPPQDKSRIGHLLYHRDEILMAQPFDESTLQPAGELFPVAERVGQGHRNYANASISLNGILGYFSGGAFTVDQQLTWYDRTGKLLAQAGTPGRHIGMALSHDETTAAVVRGTFNDADLWLHDLGRGLETRFTFDSASARSPVWSPDGRRLVYSALRSGNSNMYLKEANGTGQDELLLKSGSQRYANSWSPDGKTLLYAEAGSISWDLWTVNLTGERKPVPFANTDFNELNAQFSADGRWIAYSSDESGRYEVYIRAYPSGPGKWKISNDGGTLPRWRADGKELFFMWQGNLMGAILKAIPGAQSAIVAEVPRVLFSTKARVVTSLNHYPYAVTADGKRVLMSVPLVEDVAPITVVVNWLAAVKK